MEQEKNVFDILNERGFIAQTTDEEELRRKLGSEKITFYVGMDPTADSLHAGNFLQLMALSHLQKSGHVPIILIGGGTCMVGDPSNRTDMRKMMSIEQIQHNAQCFKKQLSKFIDFSNGRAIMVNNADWLMELQYIPFLREYGTHFSVNRMLTAESYRSRFEKGLTFLEFNYMIMQAYDFLELYRKHGCVLQTGGSDQWGNIVAGVELIRRVENASAFGLTFNLLTTSDGVKMGKTQKGAIWLDAEKTSPYEFYQYWRNIEDISVPKLLSLLTYLPMEEINRLRELSGKEVNAAKEILAFEVTKTVHGEKEAQAAQEAARALFAGAGQKDSMPTTELSHEELVAGITIIDLLEKSGLIPSKSEGRRLISQGGIKVNDKKIESHDHIIKLSDFSESELIIQKGKKVFHRIIFVNGK